MTDPRPDEASPIDDASLTAAQCRMARAGLELEAYNLAAAAGVSLDAVARLERGEAIGPALVGAIRSELEAHGVGFIEANGGGEGVRLRHGSAPHSKPPAMREVGPESEVRSGPEAPED